MSLLIVFTAISMAARTLESDTPDIGEYRKTSHIRNNSQANILYLAVISSFDPIVAQELKKKFNVNIFTSYLKQCRSLICFT